MGDEPWFIQASRVPCSVKLLCHTHTNKQSSKQSLRLPPFPRNFPLPRISDNGTNHKTEDFPSAYSHTIPTVKNPGSGYLQPVQVLLKRLHEQAVHDERVNDLSPNPTPSPRCLDEHQEIQTDDPEISGRAECGPVCQPLAFSPASFETPRSQYAQRQWHREGTTRPRPSQGAMRGQPYAAALDQKELAIESDDEEDLPIIRPEPGSGPEDARQHTPCSE